MSERIRVRSFVGPFLEHSRIFHFQNGGREQIYLGSADLMERNLSYRVEAAFPIEDPGLVRQIRELLDVYLRDNIRARILRDDGMYERLRPGPDEASVDSQRLQ